MNFHKSVRKALAEIGENNAWLAKKLKVEPSTISRILNPKKTPTTGSIERIAKALNMKPSELIALGED